MWTPKVCFCPTFIHYGARKTPISGQQDAAGYSPLTCFSPFASVFHPHVRQLLFFVSIDISVHSSVYSLFIHIFCLFPETEKKEMTVHKPLPRFMDAYRCIITGIWWVLLCEGLHKHSNITAVGKWKPVSLFTSQLSTFSPPSHWSPMLRQCLTFSLSFQMPTMHSRLYPKGVKQAFIMFLLSLSFDHQETF